MILKGDTVGEEQVVLYVTGEITQESFNRFSRRLRRMERDGVENLYLEVCSDGGDVYAALAYFDRIRGSGIEITCIATGLVASAATLIFMACHNRQMTQNAYLMLHEDSLGGIEGSQVGEIERIAKHGRRLEDQWCDLFASVSTVSREEWDRLHATETYLNADECFDLGILEKVI